MFSDKMILAMRRQGITLQSLADKLDTSPSNLSHKLKRNNFSESDMQKIAEALGCRYEYSLTIIESGEKL